MSNEKGQILLALILVITVALAIGLSVVQKSLLDVSTATKVEQSSRAFSAAEAGIEKALKDNNSGATFNADNGSSATVAPSKLVPSIPTAQSVKQDALEYEPLAIEQMAHVWLVDPYNVVMPSSTSNPPYAFNCSQIDSKKSVTCYGQNSLDVYWGAPNSNPKPAIEIKIIEYDAVNGYKSHAVGSKQAFYLDSNSSRAGNTEFIDANNPSNSDVTSDCPATPFSIKTTLGESRTFFCKSTLRKLNLTAQPMILRARILYSPNQPFAVQATGTLGSGSCPTNPNCFFLPPQETILKSIGISGQTQRSVQVVKIDKVVPPYFDYAIFSAGDINK